MHLQWSTRINASLPQVGWVVNLAQPLLAFHAWRSLWVIARTTAACLRSPKLLLLNLRCSSSNVDRHCQKCIAIMLMINPDCGLIPP